jgi:hypothetical protein
MDGEEFDSIMRRITSLIARIPASGEIGNEHHTNDSSGRFGGIRKYARGKHVLSDVANVSRKFDEHVCTSRYGVGVHNI